MLKKTIKINPELFKIADKTKKNRERKSKPNLPLVIRPNSLKKELLNRIKEHRTRSEDTVTKPSFSDQFHDSINYLTSLSKKHKDDKDREKKREIIANRTVKNYNSYNETQNVPVVSTPTFQYSQSGPMVNLELPEELQETFTPVLIEPTSIPLKINRNIQTAELPYGCLKNGNKPTFKEWQATRKNYNTLSSSVQIEPPSTNTNYENDSLNDRERKLELLRMKRNEKKLH